jgi:cyclopropane fatty-acyl-phospholipid synthase-like methyltransferase
MNQEPNAAVFFDGFAESFDTIYDGKRNAFMRWVDCTFRSDMFIRYRLTFSKLGNLQGKSVLDIGCGSGPYVIEALKRGARRVTAIDPAPHMLALTRARLEESGLGQGCTLLQATFPGPELTPHDHAIVMGVMDYVVEPGQFLAALKPLVRSSAVVSFPSKHWFRTPFRKVRYRLRQCPVFFYDASDIRRLCSEAGFAGIDIHEIPGAGMDYHVCFRP